MKDFVIISDSSCDLPAELIEKYDIEIVPMAITINGVTYHHYHDYRELSKEAYFDTLRNCAIGSTAGVNISTVSDIMEKFIKEDKDIVYFSISSALSCSYHNAVLAAEDLKEKYPNAKIEIIDTKNVCAGVGLLALLAAKAKRDGKSFEEIVSFAQENHNKINCYFTVDELSALSRSGRISHVTAIAGTALNIKPILKIDENGKIQNSDKVRGRKNAIKQMVSNIIKNTADTSSIIVVHADAFDEAEGIKQSLTEAFPNSEIIISDIGPIIGIHVGIKTLAVISLAK